MFFALLSRRKLIDFTIWDKEGTFNHLLNRTQFVLIILNSSLGFFYSVRSCSIFGEVNQYYKIQKSLYLLPGASNTGLLPRKTPPIKIYFRAIPALFAQSNPILSFSLSAYLRLHSPLYIFSYLSLNLFASSVSVCQSYVKHGYDKKMTLDN